MADVDALYMVFSNPEAMAYWDTLPHSDIEQTERFVSWMTQCDGVESDDFVVEYDGKVIGKAGFWRKHEIGYILHPDYWGQGLAKEAITVLIERAVTHHQWNHITAEIDPRNDRSRRLLMSFGFRQTGSAEKTLKLGEVWVDSAYFQLELPERP